METEKIITIKEMQAAYIEMLDEFDELCKEYHLRYDLAGGSLLGAIRHQGFIPWDNDIDISMPRPDYEKLITLTIEKKIKMHEDRDVISCKDHTFPRHYARYIRYDLRRTSEFMEDDDCPFIGIDIFTVDGAPENLESFKRQTRRIHFLRRLLLISTSKPNTSSRGKLMAVLKNILRPFLKMMGSYRIAGKMDKLCAQYNYENAVYVASHNGMYGLKERWLKEEYLPQELYKFGNREYLGYKNYDIYLSNLYGDYMKLPPLEKQIPHCDDGYYVDPKKQMKYR